MLNNNTDTLMISLTDENFIKNDPIPLYSPQNPTPTQVIFLSNIDQAVTFPVETIFFYEYTSNMDGQDIVEIIRRAIEEELLVPYYFMAGRLHFNGETRRVELVCNNAGVMFVTAKVRVSLAGLGDLAQPNPSFCHFLHRPALYRNLVDTPIFTIQVTTFECGGFAIGFMTNHAILDGKSACEMFHNLASICRGEGLKSKYVNSNRTSIRARTPPQINFPHNEYLKLAKTESQPSSFTSQKRILPSPLIFSDKYVHKLLTFNPQMLKRLKESTGVKCSTFDAILAHIWRARTMATFDDYDQESMVLFAVDIRDNVSPPLSNSFAGNAVITAFASARACDLIQRPLSFGVDMVIEGRERVTNEYIRSVIDWLEVYKGTPATSNGTFYVSPWWKLTFWEVDPGFGQLKHVGPIVSGNDEFVLFLSNGNGGINVWMGLEKEKVERLLSCAYEI